ncbi:hypothetical protein LINPERHAP1_LOCUS34500 [Linum perenne]
MCRLTGTRASRARQLSCTPLPSSKDGAPSGMISVEFPRLSPSHGCSWVTSMLLLSPRRRVVAQISIRFRLENFASAFKTVT